MLKGGSADYEYGVTLNGKDISGAVTSLTIEESIMQHIPTLSLVLSQPDNFNLQDGSEITITIVDRDDVLVTNKTLLKEKPVTFVIYSYTSSLVDGFIKFNVEATYGGADFYSIKQESFTKMSSTAAIKAALKTSPQLKMETDPTNDVQSWRRNNVSLLDFIDDVVQHSYVDTTSGMVWCVCRDNTLRVKNITALEKTNKTWEFREEPVTGKETTTTTTIGCEITGFRENPLKIFGWEQGGYGSDTYISSIMKPTIETTQKMKVSTSYSTLCLNMDYLPALTASHIDCGNVHEKYYQAEEQNSRIPALYTDSLKASLINIRNVQLLDTVRLVKKSMATPDEPEKILSGNYIVCGVRTELTQNNFNREVTIVRNGIWT